MIKVLKILLASAACISIGYISFTIISGLKSYNTKSTVTVTEYLTINTEDLKEKLDEPNWVIVDTRLSDSYNGFRLDEESRGGHIPRAVDFSASWLEVDLKNKEKVLDELLTLKGITPEKNIVLYSSYSENSLKIYTYLEEKGYENLFIYDIKEWADDITLPLVQFENYHLIVPAKIVNDILQGETPETFENAETIKIVESSWGTSSESYDKGHIPTSFHINTDSFEPPPTWMLDSDENLEKWAIENGFTKDDTVIVTSENQMAAYRLAVVLRYIGVSDVRVLNGGNSAFVSAGYELEKEPHLPIAVTDFGAKVPANPNIIVTTSQLKEKLSSQDDFCLVDNRSIEEFIGQSTGYSYHDKKGRIEQAYYGYAGKENDSSSLDYFRNIDNTMRNPNEFTALWKEQGIDITNELVFMCGSGWRAAEVMYYAEVFGLENVSLYSDGWIGWSNGGNQSIQGDIR